MRYRRGHLKLRLPGCDVTDLSGEAILKASPHDDIACSQCRFAADPRAVELGLRQKSLYFAAGSEGKSVDAIRFDLNRFEERRGLLRPSCIARNGENENGAASI